MKHLILIEKQGQEKLPGIKIPLSNQILLYNIKIHAQINPIQQIRLNPLPKVLFQPLEWYFLSLILGLDETF